LLNIQQRGIDASVSLNIGHNN